MPFYVEGSQSSGQFELLGSRAQHSTLAFVQEALGPIPEALAGIQGVEGLSGRATLKVHHLDKIALRQAGRNQKGVRFLLDGFQVKFSHIVCSLTRLPCLSYQDY